MTLFNLLSIISILLYFVIYNYRVKISKFLNVFDKPDSQRKIHKKPTPKTGSYSIALIFFLLLIINLTNRIIDPDFNFILITSILVFIVGFLDDKYKLSPLVKIISISLIISITFYQPEIFVINKFYIFTLDFFFNLNSFSYIFTLICILTLVNSFNLADGVNGLATGLVFFWIIYISQIFENNLGPIINLILIHLILIFIHNYKGRHFLGDAGSLMLSTFIALLTIYLYNKNIDNPSHLKSSETILIIFLLPILDMLRLFFERLLKGKNPTIADKNHLHHYLIAKLKYMNVSLIYFALVNIPIIISLNFISLKLISIIITIFIYFLFILYYKKKIYLKI